MAYTHMMKNTNDTLTELVTQRLNELMEGKHLSKADLARIAGVSRSSVNGWFKRGSISKDAASKLSSATGVSMSWLLGDDSGENSDLSIEEKKLIGLYRQLPGVEQANMLAAFEMRLNELKEFYMRYVLKNKE
ncbi:transcriptional repressor DicA [Serratia proteamaculans]|uniref:helix-turn-helix domain-containing protein n=1 Tax=Serratia proteamaculans TaxID=28151 RepID=UPI0021793AA0|nr:helix-turn-helix transcriptional regulator [Serratia proteamaculans]CAI1627911.1 transcriptional repressor DicA [Serratia proteamaculans]